MAHTRFAIYYVPPEGPLADFGAAWLGWDVIQGRIAESFDLPGLPGVTREPGKYGFHATLKPPFFLAEGQSPEALVQATSALAARLPPARCDGLDLTTLGRFLALTLRGDPHGINQIAADCVKELDSFRAAPSAEELARRRTPHLTVRQEAMLVQWGYPHVLEEFRFHMTLTGRMPRADIARWSERVTQLLPDLHRPFAVDQIALCGEREDRRFELIERYPLAG
ncbi:MAG: DUF1045 domain-containing protein [Pseudomonadota bacterium]